MSNSPAGGEKRTQFAMQAMGFAELFRTQFGGQRLEGTKAFVVEITEPEGPSTGGGKRVVQHVKLVPAGGGTPIVIASANPVAKTAEVRSYQAIAGGYAQRYRGQAFPLSSAMYQELTGRLSYFFDSQGLLVSISEESPLTAGSTGATPSFQAGGGSNTVMIAVIVVAALVLVGGLVVLLK